MLYDLGDRRPQVHESCFVAECAKLIGSVHMAQNASVWFNAVVRADDDAIHIGEDSNVQDGAVIHTDGGLQVQLGRGVSVGHRAMLHGCTVGDYSIVGIGAIVLNRVKIGHHCLIGAGALVTENTEIPDGSLVLGSPARVVREVTDDHRIILEVSAHHYVENTRKYRCELRPH